MTPEELLAMTPEERVILPLHDYSLNQEDCLGCKDCESCKGCRSCVTCVSCKDCVGCRYCTSCRSCEGCGTCVACVSCRNCVSCIGIKNGRNLQYVAWGVQLTREQWRKLLESST